MRKIKKPKKKTIVELIQEVHRKWNMNPSTRVQENKKKNKKKRIQEDEKIIKEEAI